MCVAGRGLKSPGGQSCLLRVLGIIPVKLALVKLLIRLTNNRLKLRLKQSCSAPRPLFFLIT